VGFELFETIMGVRMRGYGRICRGGPWWPAAMWMRLAIKPIAMRRERTKNSFLTCYTRIIRLYEAPVATAGARARFWPLLAHGSRVKPLQFAVAARQRLIATS
jgi:hypothetical protein